MNGDTPKQHDAGQDDAAWQYHSTLVHNDLSDMPPGNDDLGFSWSASEYIAHAKSPLWYMGLGAGTIVLAILIYIWTGDVFSIVAVGVMAVLLGLLAGRKPKVIQYKLNNIGLTIGTKQYPYADFKSFSIMDEGAFSSLQFMPLKRFMPPVSAYYAPEDEEHILTVLALYLPMENRENGAVEHLARRIRY